MRYDGTDCALMCGPSKDSPGPPSRGDFLHTFVERYKSEFGFTIQKRDVIIDDIRVRGVGRSDLDTEALVAASDEPPKPVSTCRVFFERGYESTDVFLLAELKAGHQLRGPAIIMDQLSTILVEPDCTAFITDRGDVRITVGSGKIKEIGPELDSIQLSIFSHRFMSIAEQMGRILQRTSISTNIKERLDFSCALFGADGGLVSNAPPYPGAPGLYAGGRAVPDEGEGHVRGGRRHPHQPPGGRRFSPARFHGHHAGLLQVSTRSMSKAL
ncbi:hypothetical protein NQ318_005169 [Aromia moschata]|uniref:Uncharacterized protein n=1 Tax=Aromia moschata TaxID=1265417 RepID=A0AAV8XIP8_9CUCU|nr:hypothetical protein NQ318_005169 [Aromia moschata]